MGLLSLQWLPTLNVGWKKVHSPTTRLFRLPSNARISLSHPVIIPSGHNVLRFRGLVDPEVILEIHFRKVSRHTRSFRPGSTFSLGETYLYESSLSEKKVVLSLEDHYVDRMICLFPPGDNSGDARQFTLKDFIRNFGEVISVSLPQAPQSSARAA